MFACIAICPFSKDVAEVSGLPVFDIDTMIDWFHGVTHPVGFLGCG
jgi:hypothetical protein